MATYSSDRRSVLKIMGAIGATCAYPYAGDELLAQAAPEHQHQRAPGTHDDAARFLSETDFRTIARIADLIIPETSTPAASGANVPAYIDRVIAQDNEQQQLVADGLRWLDEEAGGQAGHKFLDLSEDAQIRILEPLCEAADTGNNLARNVQFFSLVKKLTADGYYTSKIGLIDELGYQGNTVLSSFTGCVHEH
jgi:gluconate 2-dehydrogenase gamma chain